VRELLTELGLDFVARQVEPWPEQRDALRARAGTDSIPVLETEDGTFVVGTRSIFRHLAGCEPWEHAADHRRRFLDHRPARERNVVGQLVERAELREPVEPPVGEPTVVDDRAAGRYVLQVDGRTIGFAAYDRSEDAIAFTHTEIAVGCEGRGYGTRLVRAALDDAQARGLEVVPLCPFVRRVLRATDRP
jgi:predicted GNAT family acetyltransferase